MYPKRRSRKDLKAQWHAQRFASDEGYRLECRLRNLVRVKLKNQNAVKSSSFLDLIGCSIDELRACLERQFRPGMTWENHGRHGWHVDHVRPCASFDLTDPDQQRECFNWRNLQPLWWHENLAKGARELPLAA